MLTASGDYAQLVECKIIALDTEKWPLAERLSCSACHVYMQARCPANRATRLGGLKPGSVLLFEVLEKPWNLILDFKGT